MRNNIQISKSLFSDAYRLIHCLEVQDLDKHTKNVLKTVTEQFNGKLDTLAKREQFTKYKTAEPNNDKRELYRLEYLKSIGLHKDWKTKKEISHH